MKKILNIAIIGLILYGSVGCDGINSVHQEYLDEGEKLYIGFPEILTPRAGLERVQLVWKNNADPKIKETCIYWNNLEYQLDSMIIPIDRNDTAMWQIIDLPEGKYIFEMNNRGADGETSIPKTITSESFGTKYQNTLSARAIISQEAKGDSVQIKWASQEGCVAVHLTYENNMATEKTIVISIDETTTVIKDYVPGGEFSYTSLYVPVEGALDTIPSLATNGSFPSYYSLSKTEWTDNYSADHVHLDRSTWGITSTSEELVGTAAPNGPIKMVLDGKLNTFWVSKWKDGTLPLPHIISIDMKSIQTVSSIEIARKAGAKDTGDLTFEYSSDNENWMDCGKMAFPNNVNPNSLVVMYPNALETRYLRVTITSSLNSDKTTANMSELIVTTPQ